MQFIGLVLWRARCTFSCSRFDLMMVMASRLLFFSSWVAMQPATDRICTCCGCGDDANAAEEGEEEEVFLRAQVAKSLIRISPIKQVNRRRRSCDRSIGTKTNRSDLCHLSVVGR